MILLYKEKVSGFLFHIAAAALLKLLFLTLPSPK